MQYFKIGKFAASYGLSGELVLQHGLGKKTDLAGLETVFLEQTKDNFIPHFIEATNAKSDKETYIKLEGVSSKEAARRFTPKEVWLQEADFKQFAAKAAPIALLGYDLIDGETNLGEIIEVNEQPHQILCTVMYKGNEALIPVHEGNLIRTDDAKRKVYVEVPDGLLEIYS